MPRDKYITGRRRRRETRRDKTGGSVEGEEEEVCKLLADKLDAVYHVPLVHEKRSQYLVSRRIPSCVTTHQTAEQDDERRPVVAFKEERTNDKRWMATRQTEDATDVNAVVDSSSSGK